jgi:hypothetical protein
MQSTPFPQHTQEFARPQGTPANEATSSLGLSSNPYDDDEAEETDVEF